MQINAINSLITQSPSFSSRSNEDEDAFYGDVRKLLSGVISTGTLGHDEIDCLTKQGQNITPQEINLSTLETYQEPSKKNIFETAIAVTGVFLIPFIAGKSMVLGADKFFPNILKGITDNASKFGKAVTKNANNLISSDKLANSPKIKKAAEFAQEGIKKVYGKLSQSGKPVETMANVFGIAAAVTAAPNIITSDSNHDGIRDITQKSVSAYGNFKRNLGALKTIVDVMV